MTSIRGNISSLPSSSRPAASSLSSATAAAATSTSLSLSLSSLLLKCYQFHQNCYSSCYFCYCITLYALLLGLLLLQLLLPSQCHSIRHSSVQGSRGATRLRITHKVQLHFIPIGYFINLQVINLQVDYLQVMRTFWILIWAGYVLLPNVAICQGNLRARDADLPKPLVRHFMPFLSVSHFNGLFHCYAVPLIIRLPDSDHRIT